MYHYCSQKLLPGHHLLSISWAKVYLGLDKIFVADVWTGLPPQDRAKIGCMKKWFCHDNNYAASCVYVYVWEAEVMT